MYSIVIYLLLCAMLFVINSMKRNRKIKIEFTVLCLILTFYAIRFGMGSDTRTYVEMYNIVPLNLYDSLFVTYRFPLYTFIISIFKNIGFNYVAFLGVMNFTMFGLIGYIIYRESKNITLSLIILVGSGFIESYNTSIFRQALCMAIFMYAFFKYLKYEQYLKFYIVFTPTIFIHQMCVVFLFIPVLYYFRKSIMTRKALFVTIGLTIFGYLFVNNMLDQIIGYVMPNLKGNFSTDNSSFSIMGLGLRFTQFGLILFSAWITKERDKNDFENFQIYLNMLSFLFYLVFVNFSSMSRVCDFLEIINIVLLPNILSNALADSKKYSTFILIIMVNLVLIVTDIQFSLDSWYYNKAIINYPYISLFHPEKAVEYYEFIPNTDYMKTFK